MEFFIKKNSTLPIIKIEVIKSGRNDFNFNDELLSNSEVKFSLKNSKNDVYVILNANATINGNFIEFKLPKKYTKRIGEFIGEFTIINEQGEIKLPIGESLKINVIESHSVSDLCCIEDRSLRYVNPTETPRKTQTPTPSPTRTPTPTPTSTQTPTPTNTPTNTPTRTPTNTPNETPIIPITPSITPTKTPTPTPTPSGVVTYSPGYLLIEPQSLSIDVVNYLESNGISFPDFLGFNSASFPTTTESIRLYMELFAGGSVDGLLWYEIQIPQWGPNLFLFEEIIIPQNTISENAWYTFFIPQESLGDPENRLLEISYGTSPTSNTDFDLENTLYDFGPVYYDGDTFIEGNYRIYSTWPDQAMRANNSENDIYFAGANVFIKPTPTPTNTPTQTSTPTVTPTNTVTPTVTPTPEPTSVGLRTIYVRFDIL